MSDAFFTNVIDPWLTPALSAAIALAVLTVGWRIGMGIARRLTRHLPVAGVFVQHAEAAGYLLAVMLVLGIVLQSAPDDLPGIEGSRHVATLLFIAAVTWLAVRMCVAIAEAVDLRYPVDVVDNLGARRIRTQTRVLTRTLGAIAVVIGVSFALLTFPGVRNIGASLLASAGIAGLVAGIAARPILGNLLAGLQIALTQPIRLDDVVIVEGEWGRIEEIGHTYVVIRIWDQRRLVVPLQYFIEQPFQNWTRATSELLGTVFLWVDYGTPLDALRAELQRICSNAPEWDGRVCLIQVTDASERAMQIRALVSAADSGKAWDLRCRVREGLIDFVQRNYPGSLPRLRAEIGQPGAAPQEAAVTRP